jgi:hypothetical protein
MWLNTGWIPRSKQVHKSNCGQAQARPAGTDDWSQTASQMAL